MKKHTNYFVNLIFPAVVFGSVTGILTALVITLYKLCAKHVIAASEAGYHFLRESFVKPCVKFSVVAHNRVNENNCVFFFEVINKI